jgi:hypothetical protein
LYVTVPGCFPDHDGRIVRDVIAENVASMPRSFHVSWRGASGA